MTDHRSLSAALQGKLNFTFLSSEEEVQALMLKWDKSALPAAPKLMLESRKLLNFSDAATLLSMSEQALRDLVYKGQGPETVRRGKRVCFTHEGLDKYVSGLPKEVPCQGIKEVLTKNNCRKLSVEERTAFG